MRWAGLRFPSAAFVLGGASSALALLVALIAGGGKTGADPAVAARAALGAAEDARAAVDALTVELERARQEEARAKAQAVAAALTAELSGSGPAALTRGPESGLVHVAQDRVLAFQAPGLTTGATLSAAFPALARKLRASPAAATVLDQDGYVWALGPPLADGRQAIARAQIPAAPHRPAAIDALAGALVTLAAPAPASESPAVSVLLVLAALLGAVAAAAWAHARHSGPAARSLAAAWSFVHGEATSRADEKRGGREARELARAVNALIERAEKLHAEGEAVRNESLRAMIVAVETLATGNLGPRSYEVCGTLAPLATAVDGARRSLLERVGGIHALGTEAALGVQEVAVGARKVGRAAAEELEAIGRMGSDAEEADASLGRAAAQVESALEEARKSAVVQRRVAQTLRASLGSAGRRMADLKLVAARLEALGESTRAIEESIDLLASAATDPEAKESAMALSTRGAATARTARTALEAVRREIGAFRKDVEQVAQGIEAAVVDPPPNDADAAIGTGLHEGVLAFVRVSERLIASLRAVERAALEMRAGVEQVVKGAEMATAQVPKLAAALAGFHLGTEFESRILERLEAARKDLEEAASAWDKLTTSGRARVELVLEAAEEARSRLNRLMARAEATTEMLREARRGT